MLIFTFCFFQLSTMVWNFLQAAKHPGRLPNETAGNDPFWTFTTCILKKFTAVSLLQVHNMTIRHGRMTENPAHSLMFVNCTGICYVPPFCSFSACCLLCGSFVHRLGPDLALVVSSNNVDISQTKRWSDTGSYSWWFTGKQIVQEKKKTHTHTHTHAHKCEHITKVFSPDYSLHCTSKGRGNVKYATNWGDVQRLAQRV